MDRLIELHINEARVHAEVAESNRRMDLRIENIEKICQQLLGASADGNPNNLSNGSPSFPVKNEAELTNLEEKLEENTYFNTIVCI